MIVLWEVQVLIGGVYLKWILSQGECSFTWKRYGIS